jgi:uncharacterized protein (TIGR02246 family)
MTEATFDQAAETAEIDRVVAALEHAQQNEQPDEFIGLFRQDAIWTTGHGLRLNGRDEIAAFTRRVLPGAMRTSTARYEVVQVLFIRPDVAAVEVRQRPVSLDGQQLEGGTEGSPLYVMAKEGLSWKLVACQNTMVLDA